MRRLLPVVAALASLLALQSPAQTPEQMMGGMDMAVAQKWSAARMVKYRVEGVHKARAPVVHGDYEGKADVTDRVTVEFSWDVKKRKIVGPVTVADAKTELANIKSDRTNCPPPQLNGDYEHFQSESATLTNSGQIQIAGTRTFPAARVSNYPASCSMRSIPGAKEKANLWLAGAEPAVLAMPIMASGPIVVAKDRKSFTMKGAENWVWTFTPTIVQ
jgi:hypothetical protein